MSRQWKQADLRTVNFRSGLYFAFLIFLLALEISPAMAIGRVECGDLSIPEVLADTTRLSNTIFTAKIIRTTDSGIIKLRKRDSLVYSRIDIIVEEIMKLSGRLDLKTNQKISVYIIDENYAKVRKLAKKDFYAGNGITFLTDSNKYTISGNETYDSEIYNKIESRIKTSIWNGRSIVALPCEHYMYKKIEYIADMHSKMRDYIRLQR